jgi:hypothetical protein
VIVNFNFRDHKDWDKDAHPDQLKYGFKNMLKQPGMLCIKFLKFLCINTFKHKLEFSIVKGRVFKRTLTEKDRLVGSYWKVKDPFIKEYNYAKSLRL